MLSNIFFQLISGDNIQYLKRLPRNSIHCIITSPPYYPQIRDYGIPASIWLDGWVGCLGYEDTPEQYADHLVEIFGYASEALRDDGSLWVNIGDSYAKTNKWKNSGIYKKDLIGSPWIFAFAMRKAGWYLRNDQIWQKPNAMPESVKDRCGRSHEYLFHFAKTEYNYFDHLSAREPASESSLKRIAQKNFANQKGGEKDFGKTNVNASRSARKTIENFAKNPGRNKRTVWTIPTANSRIKHFAAYPTDLPKYCIQLSTSQGGCCSECGEPFIRQNKRERIATRPGTNCKEDKTKKANRDPLRHISIYTTLGWMKTCKCETEEIQPPIVLDPFNGSGTTGVAALNLGCSYIGIDNNSEYIEMSRKRLKAINPVFSREQIIFKELNNDNSLSRR